MRTGGGSGDAADGPGMSEPAAAGDHIRRHAFSLQWCLGPLGTYKREFRAYLLPKVRSVALRRCRELEATPLYQGMANWARRLRWPLVSWTRCGHKREGQREHRAGLLAKSDHATRNQRLLYRALPLFASHRHRTPPLSPPAPVLKHRKVREISPGHPSTSAVWQSRAARAMARPGAC